MSAVLYSYSSTLGAAVQPFAPGDALSIWLAFSTAPTSGPYGASDLADYGATVGALSLSKAQGADFGATLSIDAGGHIISWSVVVGDYRSHGPNTLTEVWANSADLLPGIVRIVARNDAGNQILAGTSPPSVWLGPTATVPEPASAWLIALALVAMALHRGCFFRRRWPTAAPGVLHSPATDRLISPAPPPAPAPAPVQPIRPAQPDTGRRGDIPPPRMR